jgi:hypothetical protein
MQMEADHNVSQTGIGKMASEMLAVSEKIHSYSQQKAESVLGELRLLFTVYHFGPTVIVVDRTPKNVIRIQSIKGIITAIVNDPDFELPDQQDITVDGFIHDVKDGTAYKENEFFSQNPLALTRILMHSDALELCNAL